MIKSMTGFGRFQSTVDGKDITVEIRSVNHRFFEFSARISRGYGFIEDKLKNFVQSQVSRGKIDVHVSIVSVDDGSVEVELNRSLAEGYINALRSLASDFGLTDDITVSSVARYSDIFTVRRAAEDEDAVWAAVKTVAQTAVDNFIAMREVEGAKLKADVESRADAIIANVEKVEAASPETLAAYRERLYNKIAEVIGDRTVDEQRVITECAIFADRIAVDEETVRLRSHIDQLRAVLSSDEPAGRKLDFIVQEINRETNTIGSKSQNSSIAHTVVDMKAEIEKIREQIQNIE
ncbi:MAG: YicC family protein [Ruminococcaceae bacterium]|nr:YicC family protein [Oscillospiraceae bacterium]